MKHLLSMILLVFGGTTFAQRQYNEQPQKAGDRIESISYNDHKRGMARALQYKPDNGAWVCINGKNRYTRALYGGHTAWRLETSDRPIFATYEKNNSRNIRFVLRLADGTSVPLDSTSWCEARYIPGKRDYRLKDPRWGADSQLTIETLAAQDAEAALWRISGRLPESCTLEAIVSDIRIKKLSRNGDMGADPPGCFEPSADGKYLQKADFVLDTVPLYLCFQNRELVCLLDDIRFNEAEKQRKALAGRIRFTTPDPYFNGLGGALTVAADGIWGMEGVWLHGAIGWRMPLSGWRAAYTGDALGWHGRARTHFDNYAASQVTDVPNTILHPAQDSTLALARSVKKWGTPMYSNGYICRNPHRNDQMHHYDMNLCYIDELLWHFCWTGDLDYARRMWPLLKAHLKWEKRNFDPDGDGLYDAYACIWASDALYYNSGAVTHSSSYNYRANKLAALIAEKIGEDPTPYQEEAAKILKGLNGRLWLDDKGHWAEFQDFMGHKRLHENAGVWTIYHALDSDVADAFQAYLATRYVDRNIPHIPVIAEGLPASEEYATISTTNWMPYAWSINNVAFAEVMHTALAYFQAGRADEGFKLLKSSVLDGMYLGESPANFGQVSFYDAARGECYRDFGDPIGVASRVFIQGLYGILPDALNGRLLVRPGFPHSWNYASLHTPDIDFSFETQGSTSVYSVTHRLSAVHTLELRFPAKGSRVKSLTINGKPTQWTLVEDAIERPCLSVTAPVDADATCRLEVVWEGDLTSASKTGEKKQVGAFRFARMTQGDMHWWTLVDEPQSLEKEAAPPQFVHVNSSACFPVVMDQAFNASVTDIFQNQYLSPRSPYTTLQLPVQGIGEWCHPLQTAIVDDSGLRASSKNGVVQTSLGIPFRTPAKGNNIAFTSLWDNYPDSLSVKLQGKASRAYLLMAGSTNHMQCHIENGVVKVYYADGSCDILSLINPDNWPPIEQLFFEDGKAFNRGLPPLYRLHLKTGRVSNRLAEELGFPGVMRIVDGGAAVLLEMPLDATKELSHLTLKTVSNEVVIGLMGVTLQK